MTVIILDIDIDVEMLLLFTALLAGRMWVWIGEWRVESLRQERNTRTRTYICVLIAVLLSLTFEIFMSCRMFHATQRATDAKIVTMFGFEHAILSVSAVSTTLSFFWLLREASTRNPLQSTQGTRIAITGGIGTSTDTDMSTENNGGCPDIATEERKDKRRWNFSLDVTAGT